jgi:hypothetical protein
MHAVNGSGASGSMSVMMGQQFRSEALFYYFRPAPVPPPAAFNFPNRNLEWQHETNLCVLRLQ